MEKEGRSVTDIYELEEHKVIEEVARLLSGTEMTEAVMTNARELKELAIKTKQNIN